MLIKGSWFDSLQGHRILLLIKESRPVLTFTKLSTETVKRALHPEVNQLKNEDYYSHVCRDEVKNRLKHTPIPQIPSWHDQGRGV